MAILGSLFGLLGRFAGKLLNSALGWASLLLFGRVPQSKQYILLGITLGSLLWVVAVLGVVLPDVGVFLVAAVPAPAFVDRTWIRIGMLVAALVLPLLVGAGSIALMSRERRPKGLATARALLRGYPFAAVLAISLAFLAVIAFVRKLRSLSKRWEDAHVPVVVRLGGYDEVVEAIREALDDERLDVEPRLAPRVVELPAHLLAAVAEAGVRELVPARLMELKGPDCEVFVYPSDIAISGSKDRLARARAAIATRLTAAPAYLTTTAEAQQIEERIERILAGVREADAGERPIDLDRAMRELAAVDRELTHVVVPHEEWETLYRMRLQAERDALALARQDVGQPDREEATRPGGRPRRPRASQAAQWAVPVAALLLVALDLALTAAERVAPTRPRH